MQGPAPKGTWSQAIEPRHYGMLEPGRRYAVVQQFTDFDGVLHQEGERWRYLTYAFLPYEDGLSLFVSLDDESEWHIRLQDRPEQQGRIVEGLGTYLAPLPGDAAPRAPHPPSLGLGRIAFTAAITVSVAAAVTFGHILTGGSALRTAAIVVAAGLVSAILAYAAWPRRRERFLLPMIQLDMPARNVKLLLGEPAQALEVSPGPVATRWIYSPRTMVAGRQIGIRLAIDFDFSEQVMHVQRL